MWIEDVQERPFGHVFSFKQSILYRNAFLKLLCSFCTACFGSLPQGLQQCQLQLCVAWCRVDFVFFRPSQNLFPQSPDRRVDGPEHRNFRNACSMLSTWCGQCRKACSIEQGFIKGLLYQNLDTYNGLHHPQTKIVSEEWGWKDHPSPFRGMLSPASSSISVWSYIIGATKLHTPSYTRVVFLFSSLTLRSK